MNTQNKQEVKMKKTVLVTGATGNQGGAVIRHLLKGEWDVKALVRTKESENAKKLEALGVTLCEGDFEDLLSLKMAMNDVYGVFASTNYFDGFPNKKLGFDGEVRQGKNLVDAAKEADVKHFVYSAGGGSNPYPCNAFHIRSKQEVERYIIKAGLNSTIVRPCFFMENFVSPLFGITQQVEEGKLEIPMKSDKKLQMIATDDIGAMIKIVFDNPNDFLNYSFDLAGDQMNPIEIANLYSDILNKKVEFKGTHLAIEAYKARSIEVGDMWEVLNEHGGNSFIPGLRKIHPEMTNLKTFLTRYYN